MVAAVFSGGKVQKRFQPLLAKWSLVIQIFLMAVNRENGTMGISPLESITYPCRTFTIMSFLQGEFIAALKKNIDEQSAKSKRRTR